MADNDLTQPTLTQPLGEASVLPSPTPSSNKQSIFGRLKDKLTSWPSLILVSFVFGVLLPPVSLAIAVYLIIKGLRTQRKKLYLVALSLILATALGIGVYIKLYPTIFKDRYYSYKYTAFDEYKLDSKTAGSGLSLSKPVNFKEIGQKVQVGSASALLAHKDTTSKLSLGYIAITSVNSALAASSSYLEVLNKTLQEPNDKNYETLVRPVREYVNRYTDFKYQIELGKATKLIAPNIKANAWQFDFSAKTIADKSITPLKGKAVLVAGKQTFYYILLSNVENNWQANQAVWQQVLDSIKIDQ